MLGGAVRAEFSEGRNSSGAERKARLFDFRLANLEVFCFCGADVRRKNFLLRLRVVIPALLLGGNWDNATNCGSRSRNANNARSNANTNIGGRGAIRRLLVSFEKKRKALTPRAYEIARTPAESLTLAECQNTKRRVFPFGSGNAKNGNTVFFLFGGGNMKRYDNLWQKIITKENFYLAEKEARKRKTRKDYVKEFEKNLDENLEAARQLVITKQFHTSQYRSRKIYEPKERTLYILPYAPDRIVQHAIMNVLAPIMKSLFISDTYSGILGRGQLAASLRAMEAVRRNKYCLQCDIHKFYPSINQNVLSQLYHNKFKDKDFLEIMDDIIFSFPGDYNCPIGNPISSLNGNFYLTPLDHFCKQELGIKDYFRFCDDFLLFGNDKSYLHDCRHRIEDFIGKYDLTYSRADVFNVKQGIDVVGYRHFDNYILVRKSTAKKEKKLIKELPGRFERGEISADTARSSIDSVAGHIKHANSYNLKKSMRIDEIRRQYVA